MRRSPSSPPSIRGAQNQPPPLIDVDAEVAAIKAQLANSETAVAESKATMAALIKKGVLTTEEIETKNDEKAKR